MPEVKRALSRGGSIGVDDLSTATGQCLELLPVGACQNLARKRQIGNGLNEYTLEALNHPRKVVILAFDGQIIGAYLRPRRIRKWLLFDHDGWMEFARTTLNEEVAWLPQDPTTVNPQETMAYLRLLGVLGGIEYGSFCGTGGSPVDGRLEVMYLANRHRTDLLSKVLHGPNITGRVYAAEALLVLKTEGYKLSTREESAIIALRSNNTEPIATSCLGPGTPASFLTDDHVAAILSLWRDARSWGTWTYP